MDFYSLMSIQKPYQSSVMQFIRLSEHTLYDPRGTRLNVFSFHAFYGACNYHREFYFFQLFLGRS